MCDRALPDERFIGRITRKKGNYAEATKLQTLTPPFHTVYAPCVYVPHCGGCKTQNLAFQAQVRDLIIHVGRFSQKELELHGIMKPIVPCDIQFHYRNKMEFSFGPYKWLPKELLHEGNVDGGSENYALGLHVPGFFDKIINVDKCLLQTDPANKVLAAIQECWRDPQLGFSPYNVHSHMSSAAGKTPAPGQAIYSASKFTLNGYFHSLRSELCQKGIQVTVVCPGHLAPLLSYTSCTTSLFMRLNVYDVTHTYKFVLDSTHNEVIFSLGIMVFQDFKVPFTVTLEGSIKITIEIKVEVCA
ncbi:hypothetical protein RYX36_007154 [Vicia faba]